MSYRKTGGQHFVKVGCLWFSFWVAKKKAQRVTVASIRADARANRDSRVNFIGALNQANAMLALASIGACAGFVFGVI